MPPAANKISVKNWVPRRVRPLDLDRHAMAVRQRRPVHLADRRRCNGGRLELGEQLLDRELEILVDDALDVLVRERADVVLERLQLEQDVRRDDVRPRREELAAFGLSLGDVDGKFCDDLL